MMKYSTQVPNILFDEYLPKLTESELKILLVITRQTSGWIDKHTGRRKTRDRISQSQFRIKTGLSIRTVSETLKSLSNQGLIAITDANHQLLQNSLQRRGKTKLYYSLKDMHFGTSTYAIRVPEHMQKDAYNKRNYTKENITKGSHLPIRQNTSGTIGEIIEQSKHQSLLRL